MSLLSKKFFNNLTVKKRWNRSLAHINLKRLPAHTLAINHTKPQGSIYVNTRSDEYKYWISRTRTPNCVHRKHYLIPQFMSPKLKTSQAHQLCSHLIADFLLTLLPHLGIVLNRFILITLVVFVSTIIIHIPIRLFAIILVKVIAVSFTVIMRIAVVCQ